jgi:hypothetical protein
MNFKVSQKLENKMTSWLAELLLDFQTKRCFVQTVVTPSQNKYEKNLITYCQSGGITVGGSTVQACNEASEFVFTTSYCDLALTSI